MSDGSGRWVWCPQGWRVVPDDYVYDREMRCPEPPSGWRRDTPPRGEPILTQRWAEKTFEVITTYTSGVVHGYWWTPLPPPPEEQS